MSDTGLKSMWTAVRSAEGAAPNERIWGTLSMLIGVAWQKHEISDDDARALEEMLRALRFPRP